MTGTTGSAYQRSESTTNYEVSKSVSRVVSAAGQVKRLSISVLVDNITNTTTYSAIQPSVIAAAGVDFARGDVVSVSNVVFDRSFYADQETAIAAAEQRDFILKLAQWGAVAAALLVLFLVVRGIQRSLRAPQLAAQRVEISAPPSVPLPADARAALLQEAGRREPGAAGAAAIRTIGPPTFDADAQAAAEKAQMVRQLQQMAKNRPDTVAQIIQFWMQEDKK
jgi:flagellar M-ring protein FliF